MITIELNGERQQIAPKTTVTALLAAMGSDGSSVAVVVNEEIIRPESRSTRSLEEGDHVDVLMFAGGG